MSGGVQGSEAVAAPRPDRPSGAVPERAPAPGRRRSPSRPCRRPPVRRAGRGCGMSAERARQSASVSWSGWARTSSIRPDASTAAMASRDSGSALIRPRPAASVCPARHAPARLHLHAGVEPGALPHARARRRSWRRRPPARPARASRPRPRARARPSTLSRTAASAPTITRSCSTARSTRASVPTEQLRPSTLCGPTCAPATSEPSSTSEPVSSRAGRVDATRPASRSQVASR